MILLIASALYVVLLYRLGFLPSFKERRAELAFQESVCQLGEEVEWKDRMKRADQRMAPIHKMPSLHFKVGPLR